MIHALVKKAPLWVILVLAGPVFGMSQENASSSGMKSLSPLARDLRGDYTVMNVVLQPGFEDFEALTYFRFLKGARIVTMYLTNGEAGESDVRSEYPHILASVRRSEASRALSYLGGECFFLNLPDVIAAKDSGEIRANWRSDTVQARVKHAISIFRPDLILISADRRTTSFSQQLRALVSDVLAAVQAPPRFQFLGRGMWRVKRVMLQSFDGKGLRAPPDATIPELRKTVKIVAKEALGKYSSLSRTSVRWEDNKKPSYVVVYPGGKAQQLRSIDSGLPGVPTARLQWIHGSIKSIAKKLESPNPRILSSGPEKQKFLKAVVNVMDSLDFLLTYGYDLGPREQRSLLHWKAGIEQLRNKLLGVEVKFSVSDSILAQSQLTYLTFEKVEGGTPEGTTEVLFPFVGNEWVLNEDLLRRVPLRIGEEYRLLSPRTLSFHLPASVNGLERPALSDDFDFFVIHRGSTKEQSFVHKSTLQFSYAPRFTTEVLTPIIRMVRGERIVVRETNHTRDGLADFIHIDDSLASAPRIRFRIPNKGDVYTDTLILEPKLDIPDGSYFIPIKIGDIPVAQVVARKFDVSYDSTKKVGLVTSFPAGITEETLRRIGVRYRLMILDSPIVDQIKDLDVLILDRRSLTLDSRIADMAQELQKFVKAGGHLLVLAQESAEWGKFALRGSVLLSQASDLSGTIGVTTDESDRLLNFPNKIFAEDWDGWLFLRGYNRVTVKSNADTKMPVRVAEDGSPLVVSTRSGAGSLTYVDLAFQHQWMNIHEGAFKLLANLISY